MSKRQYIDVNHLSNHPSIISLLQHLKDKYTFGWSHNLYVTGLFISFDYDKGQSPDMFVARDSKNNQSTIGETRKYTCQGYAPIYFFQHLSTNISVLTHLFLNMKKKLIRGRAPLRL